MGAGQEVKAQAPVEGALKEGKKEKKKAKKSKQEVLAVAAGAGEGGHAEVDVSAWRAFALHPLLEQALGQLVGAPLQIITIKVIASPGAYTACCSCMEGVLHCIPCWSRHWGSW